MRAVGDTKRPLIFLAIGGVANVGLNIFFVTVCGMTVEGVAIATVISQAIATILSLIVLFKSDGYASLKLKFLKIYKEQFKEIIKIAIPSAIQSVAFNISNVLFQSKVNSLGKMTISANAAASQFDGIVYNVGHAVALSCMAFVSQNVGAKRMDRVKTCIIDSLILCAALTLSVASLVLLFGEWLCGFIVNGEEIISLAVTRLSVIGMFQFLCASMDVLSFSVRSLGRPNISMIVSIIGAVIIRIIALEVLCLIFPGVYSAMLFAYPICWSLTIVMYIFILPRVYKQVKLKITNANVE